MASVGIEVVVTGDKEVEALIQSLIDHAGDITPAYVAVAESMRAYEGELFDSEGAISGEPWAPDSDETIRTKQQKGYPDEIEKATEELFHSLVDQANDLHIEEITPEYLRFGTSSEHAGYQQKGTSKAPVRKIIDFREQDVVGFTAIISHYIRHGVIQQSLVQP